MNNDGGYFKEEGNNNNNNNNNNNAGQGYFKAPEQSGGEVNQNYFKKNPQDMQYNFPVKSTGTISLILGILAIVLGFGLILGIPAIVFGKQNTDPKQQGSATAGVVLGWIATVISILVIILVIWLVSLAASTYM